MAAASDSMFLSANLPGRGEEQQSRTGWSSSLQKIDLTILYSCPGQLFSHLLGEFLPSDISRLL
ncbi:hypothetical protein RvY_08965 [Ramazzottius varieornatus]|uniref:Uncharacterized protein n=1 Tax=Ramazzottius varieornatus TaxID=947166 RepID=A0A1D1V7R6_RAMVA|nr:hypothetical protein RvY_08965 [Ramazzottius varieornatus]